MKPHASYSSARPDPEYRYSPEYRAKLAAIARNRRDLHNELGLRVRPAQDAAYHEWEERVESGKRQ